MPTGMVIDAIRSLAQDPDREPDGELVERFAAASCRCRRFMASARALVAVRTATP